MAITSWEICYLWRRPGTFKHLRYRWNGSSCHCLPFIFISSPHTQTPILRFIFLSLSTRASFWFPIGS